MSKILVNEKNIVFSCIIFNFYYFETTPMYIFTIFRHFLLIITLFSFDNLDF